MSQEINIKIGVEAKEANQTVGQFKQNLQGIDNAQKNVADSTLKVNQNLKTTSSNIKNLGIEGASRGIEKLGTGFTNLKLSNVASGFRMLGVAIAANPIGALITVVTTLIGAFGGFQVIIDAITSSFKALFGPLMSMISGQKDYKTEIDNTTKSIELYEKRLDSLNTRYKREEINIKNQIDMLKAQGASIEEINKKEDELLKTRVNNSSTLIAENKQQLLSLAGLREQGTMTDEVLTFLARKSIKETTDRIKDKEEKSKKEEELNNALNNTLKNLDEARFERQQAIIQREIKSEQTKTEAKKKAIDDSKKFTNDQIQKDLQRTKTEEEEDKKRIKAQNDAFEITKKLLDDEVQSVEKNRIEKLASYQQDFLDGVITFETLQAEKVLLEKQANEEIIAIREGFRISDVEKIKIGLDNLKKLTDDNQKEISKITQENLDIDVNLTKNYNDWKKKEDEEASEFKEQQRLEDIEREKEASEVRKKINEEEEEKKRAEAVETQRLSFEFASASLNAISTLTDIVFENRKIKAEAGSKVEEALARKQFQINKALQLGTAVINGIQSILAITSVPDFTLGVQSALRIGAQVVLNAASIAKIAAQTFQPTATSATSPSLPSTTGAGAAPQTPTFTPTSFFGLGQTTQFNPQEQGPTRVYVTEGDISNTQNRVRVVENRARFG